MKKFLMLTAITMIAACSVVIAQQDPTLKPSVSAKRLEPVQLLLEIQYNPEVPPPYCTVKGLEEKAG